MTTLEIERFTSFAVAADGERITLDCVDASGAPCAVVIRGEHLKELMMTLPEIARQSLRRKYRDPSLRLVYPVAAWALEAGTDGRMILTLRTPDRFEIAFALATQMIQTIAAACNENAGSVRPN